MRRRAFISLATVLPLAGCTSMLGGGGVDTTIGDDELVEFEADEGAELSVTVEVQELADPEDEDGDAADVDRDALTFRLDHADTGPVDTWTVSDAETFDVSIDEGGTHVAMVIGGTADVTIE